MGTGRAWVLAQLLQSCLALSDPWTVAGQAPLSMGFSRHECWSGLPCPPPGDLPYPGIKLTSLLYWHAGFLPLASPGKLKTTIWPRNPTTEPVPLLLFSHYVIPDFSWPHGLQHARPPCPSPSPRVCPSSCPLNQWCYPTISSSTTHFSFCLQSFPASESFHIRYCL